MKVVEYVYLYYYSYYKKFHFDTFLMIPEKQRTFVQKRSIFGKMGLMSKIFRDYYYWKL